MSGLRRSASTSSTNGGRGPDLNGALATECWKKVIASDNAAAKKLEKMIQAKVLARSASLSSMRSYNAMPTAHTPMPPTSMALMMSRLKHSESRTVALRRSGSLDRLPRTLPALATRSGAHASMLTATRYAPVKLLSRPTPWR